MIVPHDNKYWLDFYDDINALGITNYAGLFEENPDGFWVVFLDKNIYYDENKKNSFVEQIILFMYKYNIPFLKVSLPYYDRIIVFTSCSRNDIKETQNKIISFFNFDKSKLIWEAFFESDDSWKSDGWLSIMNKSFEKVDGIIPNELKETINYKNAIALRSKAYKKVLEEVIMNRTSMIVKPVFGNISYDIKEKSVFVIMPFGEEWSNDIYKCIKEVCNKHRIIATRADDFTSPGVILDDIWKQINSSALIVADISVHNANVFYELGIAHTIGKDVVMIHQRDGDHVPFDINSRRYVSYGLLPSEFEKFKDDLDIVLTNYFKIK